jgi:hypothetical protein
VLAALLDKIVDEGRRFAATADMKVSDMSANAPVGTTLALLERQLKVMTAVQARVHYALKQELGLLKEIIRDYTDDTYTYEPEGNDGPRAKKSDYAHVDVIPVSDPNAATMSQRVVQYQAVIQMAQMAPDIYDLPQLHRNMLEVLGIKNADKLVPLPDDQKPKDPVTENMEVLKGEPIKAFVEQDHAAHIAVHTSMMQDPTVMQLMGQNPKAPQIQAALTAHIAEHVGFQYKLQLEKQLGMSLPRKEEVVPTEIANAMAGMMAQAAQQMLQQNQAQAAQQQAQQQAQDPLIQMQQQELQLKQAEMQVKQQEVQANIQLGQQRLQLEAQKVQQDFQLKQQAAQLDAQKMVADMTAKSDKMELDTEKLRSDNELQGMRIGAQIEESKAKQQFDQEYAGVKLGAEISKRKKEMDLQARTTALQQTTRNQGKEPK